MNYDKLCCGFGNKSLKYLVPSNLNGKRNFKNKTNIEQCGGAFSMLADMGERCWVADKKKWSVWC